jgi:surface glycoprotein (TIGR04207 family)
MSGHEKTRAVVLTAIMVISVFAMGFAFAGGAAASDVDRNGSDNGTVDPGTDNVEVLDFTLTSEDQVLDAEPDDIGNDGDVEPGDELESLDPGQYSYVDDNGNQEYEADETLILDGQGDGTFNDQLDDRDEIIRYTDGAFIP